MRWHRLLAVLVLGSVGAGGSAAALTIAQLDRDAVVGPRAAPEACARSGCLQPVQMWQFGGRERADPMPSDQRELLARLLSPELSEVVSPAERDLLSKTLDRGDRLSAQAVSQLSALLREKQSLRAERLATAERAREEERRRQAAAEADRQRQAELAKAEAERQRQAELAAAAEAERQRQGQAQATTSEAERRRQTEQAAAAKRQRQAEAQASAEAERQRQAELAAAAAERQRQAAEAAQALAEAKREAEAAATNAARLVFYDEFPPLQPL